MKIYKDISLRNFDFWSGAVDTAEKLTDEQLDRVEAELEVLYPDGVSDTFINDLFWFEEKTVFEWAGYDPFENRVLYDRPTPQHVVNEIAEYLNESFKIALAFTALAIMIGENVSEIKEDFEIEDEDLHKYSYFNSDYLIGTQNEINETLKAIVYSEEYEEIWREKRDIGETELSLEEWRKDLMKPHNQSESWECVFGVKRWGDYLVDCKTIYVLEVTNI